MRHYPSAYLLFPKRATGPALFIRYEESGVTHVWAAASSERDSLVIAAADMTAGGEMVEE